MLNSSTSSHRFNTAIRHLLFVSMLALFALRCGGDASEMDDNSPESPEVVDPLEIVEPTVSDLHPPAPAAFAAPALRPLRDPMTYVPSDDNPGGVNGDRPARAE